MSGLLNINNFSSL